MAPPNIIYIHSHDTGRYVQPYGYGVSTPNLQRFAEQGVLFRNAFSAAPTCSPSRAALLTGQYAHQNGMTALAHQGGCLIDPSQHLANVFNRHGYATAIGGVQHVTHDKTEAIHKLGYQRILSQEKWPAWANDFEARNTWYSQAASEYVLKSTPTTPFFLDCGFDLTHRMGPGEQWHTTRAAPAGDPRYVRPPVPLPDTAQTRRDFADYAVAVGMLDECIGRLLAAIDLAGITNHTLVFITVDHGLAYPFMKCNLTAHGIGIMLLIRGPGGFTGGKVVDGLASHVDIYPTLMEVAGLTAPTWLQGVCLTPLVAGVESVRDAVFAEVNWHAAPEPMRTVRTNRYSYIRRFQPHTGPVLPNCDDSVSKSLLRTAGWDGRPQSAEELYDLIFDPNEACNRASDPAYGEALEAMRSRLQTWMEQTQDPLLTGRIDPWPGAACMGVADVSPQGYWPPAQPIVINGTGRLLLEENAC